jgi:anti-anti-sigma regulatory factor/PAS domain-containing protein
MVDGDKATSGDATASTVARLADLTAALGAAGDEPQVLTATMDYLGQFGAQGARLLYLHCDAQGVPQQLQPIASWQRGRAAVATAADERHSLLADPLLARCLASRDQPVAVSSFSEPAAAALGRLCDEPLSCQALVLLPLRSEAYSGWQGVLALSFDTPHDMSADERSTYRLLMAVLATHIGGQRTQRALAAALAEAAVLQKMTEQLNVAVNLDQALQALLTPAPSPDEAEVSLCTIETSADGAAEWLTVIGTLDGAGMPARSKLGMRYHVPDIPFARLYLSAPNTPIMVADVQNDPRVDAYARQLYAATETRATIAMAMTLQGRWVGLFSVTWKRPVVFSERLGRIYSAIARQASLLLDNSQMLERVRSSLKTAQDKGALLRSVLDNIPIGVVLLAAPDSKPLLSNTWLYRVLGAPIDPNSSGDSLVSQFGMVHPGTERPLDMSELPSQRVIRSGKTEVTELDFILKEGQRVSTEVTGVPIFDDTGTVKQVVVLISDLSARKRAEQDRMRMQDEVIRIQAAALAERSSPLIPITDEILVLPLIGSIDTERGQQVLDTVLHGTSERGAKVAIIDITGVRTVDTQAASALTSAAQALRLLGVEPVLTGIRPEVAQTLVGLGVNLLSITTRSTLQSGISYALKHLGKSKLA